MMAAIKSKDTKPEILVRQVLHANGFRFSLHKKTLPGTPDVVLNKWRCVIFVHGCFWHGHESCPLYRPPKSRSAFWDEKISANKRRDAFVDSQYTKTQWRVLRVWECAIKGKSRLGVQDFKHDLIDFIVNKADEKNEIRGYPLE